MVRANRKLKKDSDTAKEENIPIDDLRLELSRDMLENDLTTDLQRLYRIEDKASKTLLGITTAVTIWGVGVGLITSNPILKTESGLMQLVSSLFLFCGFISLLMSGYLALLAYEVGETYTPSLKDRASSQQEPVVYKRTLLFCIQQNQRRALMRTNRLDVCFKLLRNGIIAIFLFASLAIFSNFIFPTEIPTLHIKSHVCAPVTSYLQ